MTHDEFALAAAYLVLNGTIFPYNITPGGFPGGQKDVYSTQEKWDEYEYNPPQFLKHLDEYSDVDITAASKPTYLGLQTAATVGATEPKIL